MTPNTGGEGSQETRAGVFWFQICVLVVGKQSRPPVSAYQRHRYSDALCFQRRKKVEKTSPDPTKAIERSEDYGLDGSIRRRLPICRLSSPSWVHFHRRF